MKLIDSIYRLRRPAFLLKGAVFLLLAAGCNPADLPDTHTDPSTYYLKGELDGEAFEWSQTNDSSYIFTGYKVQYNRILMMQNRMGGVLCQGNCANSFQFSFIGRQTYKQDGVILDEMLPVAKYQFASHTEQDTGLFCQIIPQEIAPHEYIWNYGFGKPIANQDFYWKLYGYSNQVCLRSTYSTIQDPVTYTTNFDMLGDNVDLRLKLKSVSGVDATVEVSSDQAGPVWRSWSNGSTSSTATFSMQDYSQVHSVEVTNTKGLSTKIQFALVMQNSQPYIVYQPFTDTLETQMTQSSKGKVAMTYIDAEGHAWHSLLADQYAGNQLEILETSEGPLNEYSQPTVNMKIRFNGYLQDSWGNRKYLKNFEGHIAVGRPD